MKILIVIVGLASALLIIAGVVIAGRERPNDPCGVMLAFAGLLGLGLILTLLVVYYGAG